MNLLLYFICQNIQIYFETFQLCCLVDGCLTLQWMILNGRDLPIAINAFNFLISVDRSGMKFLLATHWHSIFFSILNICIYF